ANVLMLPNVGQQARSGLGQLGGTHKNARLESQRPTGGIFLVRQDRTCPAETRHVQGASRHVLMRRREQRVTVGRERVPAQDLGDKVIVHLRLRPCPSASDGLKRAQV